MAGRILVVDGAPTNRITMKVRLSSACYEVATAATGQEALRMARLIHPQIVLIGTGLPDIGGPMLCAALRALPQGTDRSRVAQRAADAVHALLIQRESCGLRDERAVFRDYQVPGEVIARIGATPRPE